MDVEVRGGDQFYALSRALKAAGRTDLRKELSKQLRDGAKPLIPVAREAARRMVPDAGGLAAQVAKEPMRVQVRTGRATAGVRVVMARRRGGGRSSNRGVIRHPVFGNRDRWVSQRVPSAAGWFDDTLDREAPRQVRPAIERALSDMADRVVRETRRGGV